MKLFLKISIYLFGCRVLVVARGIFVVSCTSSVAAHRFSLCGMRASLLCGTWNLYGSGIEPMTPASAGRFFTTEPPELPCSFMFSFNPSCVPTCPAPCLAHADDDC